MTDSTTSPKVFPEATDSTLPTASANGSAEFAFSVITTAGSKEYFRLLRRLRAEVQELRIVINLVQAGTTTLQNQASYLKKTKEDLSSIQQELAQIVDGNDTTDRLLNILEQMEHSPLLAEQPQELPGQDQINATLILMRQVQQVELLVGLLTIPARLNEWLANSKPGFYIPFHLVFSDEIPSEEDRRTILNFLAWSPVLIKNGIVDMTNGLVFRYAEDAKARWRSVAWLIGGIVVSLVVVVGLAYLPLPGWLADQSSQRAAGFTIAWLAVLIGVITHIGVAGVKREQETRLPTILAITSLGETIDARLGQILWKLLLVLIGLFAVVFAIDPNNVSLVNAFLVGYSLDSIVGVFGANIENKVKAVQEQFAAK